MENSMKLVSWNVNGIRAVLKKGLAEFVAEEQPDVLCLQETKLGRDQYHLVTDPLPGYQALWCGGEKRGYSGVAAFCATEPLAVIEGLGIDEFDREGRVQTLEFPAFYLVNAYFPNSQPELARLDYKLAFDNAFLEHCQQLRSIKPVLFCGDLNVAHQEIDLAHPRANQMNPGFYIDERNWFTRMLEAGYRDTFRMFESDGGHYTWWTYRANARTNNVGWRIDYFVACEELAPLVKESTILSRVMGSDHCPIRLVLRMEE